MTADELAEKVARVICESAGLDPDEFHGPPEKSFLQWRLYIDEARAAVALVVEECAKAVVDKATQIGKQECCGVVVSHGHWPPECCGNPLYMLSDVDAAYAILSISPSSGVKDREAGR